jgi:hypothetical protein
VKLFLVLFITLVAEVQAGSCVCGISKELSFDHQKFEECTKDIYSRSDSQDSYVDCSSAYKDPVTQAICDARDALERSQEVGLRGCKALATSNKSELIIILEGQKVMLDLLPSKDECRKTLLETPECR